MSTHLDKYAAKGNEFIKLVATGLEIPRDMAERVTRAVFHALRNCLSHEESFQLMAQLPMVLKGVYVDGWKYSRAFQRLKNLEDFLDEVRKEDGKMAGYDFGNNQRATEAVAAVFNAMQFFVSEGEMSDISGMMPREIQEFIRKTLEGNNIVM